MRHGQGGPGTLVPPEGLHGRVSDRPGLRQVRSGSSGAGRVRGLDAGGSELRVLLAHNAATPTCDALARHIEALGATLTDASSSDDARLVVEAEIFDACLVCLDLLPAPFAGVRLASELLARGCPVVLVTRSLRWLPADATELRKLPWIPPDASTEALQRALAAASEVQDSSVRERSEPHAPSSRAARL
ncbi:hypothetical protein [Chondromyces apiculatus]|uniref:Response regulatory domain-containing protein n=1 Tax=Chondromyces apiculatus DSM 436 TaxID=1192034 RepID=A0A017SW05_9BACT|nr:hypothetical protein [Chondromyces apiculatus]EYF00481.1 Hypothetical protein CAP_0571 [Chondromyces apiculatus DSM 436]